MDAEWPQDLLDVLFLATSVWVDSTLEEEAQLIDLIQSSHSEDEKTEGEIEEVPCPKTCF